MRIGLAVFLAFTVAAGPALAEWQFRSSGTTAGVWVRNDDGTSLALNCEGAGDGRLRMDLTVAPTEDPLGDMATFQVGGFSVDGATEPYGPEGQRLQILRLDVDYFDAAIAELRTQMKRGSVLSLPAQPGFNAVQFALRGSGAAIEQLEAACPTVWDIARAIQEG